MVLVQDMLISDKSTIKQAMRVIDLAGLKMALIINDEKKFEGVVTDGDIRRGILNGISIHDPVSTVMVRNPLFSNETFLSQEILSIASSQKLIGIPIIDSEKNVQDFVLLENNKPTYLSKRNYQTHKVESVLVLGGAGFIGSMLVRRLLEQGYKVRVLDLFLYGKESLFGLNNTNLEIIEGDTRHVETLTNCVQGVDAVIHLAELVGDPACALNPKTTQDINYIATNLVASVCKHYQINRFIYLSSCSVYGASQGDELLTEESSINPVSLYAKMKLTAESAIRGMSDDNFSPTILRLSTVYGASFRPRFDLVVNTLTAKAKREGKITIFGGDQWRPNVHVKDVAKAIMMVLASPLRNVANQVFNVGSESQNHTINEIGEIISKKLPSASVIIEERDFDKRNYRVSFERIRNAIGFTPDFTIEDGVLEIEKQLDGSGIKDHNENQYNNVKFLKSINKF